MAKDPICGMFVEENENSIHHSKEGISYYFCSSQCLNEFLEPEKALKKLKMHVLISIVLTIPIVLFQLTTYDSTTGTSLSSRNDGIYQLLAFSFGYSNTILDRMAFLQRILGWYQSKSIKYGYIDRYWNNELRMFIVL